MPFTEAETSKILDALRAGKTVDTGDHRNAFEYGWADGYWYREMQDFDWYDRYECDESRIRQAMANHEPAFRALLDV